MGSLLIIAGIATIVWSFILKRKKIAEAKNTEMKGNNIIDNIEAVKSTYGTSIWLTLLGIIMIGAGIILKAIAPLLERLG